MKRLFLSLVAMMIATVSFAQNHLVATLTHEGTIKNFYGASALQEAHEAATHGDIINMSSGTFTATNITKAITLRGAGMDSDSIMNREPTCIAGSFTINITDEISTNLTIEGISNNGHVQYDYVKNPTFIRCRFYYFQSSSSTSSQRTMLNATFIHCKFANTSSAGTGGVFYNCIINYIHSNGANEFSNCIIMRDGGMGSSDLKATYKNCFICTKTSDQFGYSSNATMYNNIGINILNPENNKYIFNKTSYSSNKTVSSLSEVFKTWKGEWDDNETFELTDEAKAKYLGTDGTQIGIYGGDFPFESTPSNPQITNCEVAKKSTADGKLSVKITVNTRD